MINLQDEPVKTMDLRYEEDSGVCTALLRLFIENNASLNNLYMDNCYSQIYDMVLNHPKFISEIEIFSLRSADLISTQTFLSSLNFIIIRFY